MSASRAVAMPATRGVVAVVLRILAAVTLATSWSLGAALPAAAEVVDFGVESPSAGAVVASATPLVAYVDRTTPPPDEDGNVPKERVEMRSRLLDGGRNPVSSKIVRLTPGDQSEVQPGVERARFFGEINPYSLVWLTVPAAAPNGRYILQVQFQNTAGDVSRDPSEWRDHPIVLDAPPPATTATAEVADAAAKQVRVDWNSVDVPDLLYYDVERQAGGGDWVAAAAGVDPGTTTVTDSVGEAGSYRYRVVAVRAGAEKGSTLSSTSAATESVTVAAATEPPPTDGDDGDDEGPDDTGGDEPGDDEPGDDEPGDGDGSDDGGSEFEFGDDVGDGGDAGSGGGDSGRAGADAGGGAGRGGGGSRLVPRAGGSTSADGGGTGSSGSSSGFELTGITPRAAGADDDDSGSDGFGDGDGVDLADADEDQQPAVAAPSDVDTFRKKLDYGNRGELVERIPKDVVRDGGFTEDGGTLSIVNRELDEQRVLPAVAGGLVLVLSAAHVLRFLNE